MTRVHSVFHAQVGEALEEAAREMEAWGFDPGNATLKVDVRQEKGTWTIEARILPSMTRVHMRAREGRASR